MADTQKPNESRAALGLHTGIRVLAVVALVVVANLLSFKYYRRIDLSGATVAPLTEPTKPLLIALPKPPKLILFFPSDHVLYDSVNLVALQYQAASRGISVETVNPYRDQTRAAEVAQQFKIGTRESAVIVDYNGRAKVITSEDLADFDRAP